MKMAVVIYDGECNLCNAAVRTIRRADKQKRFTYVPYREALTNGLISESVKADITGDEIALYYNQQIYVGHSAVSVIAHLLGGIYKPLGYIWDVLPVRFKRWLYWFVAQNRYRLGKTKSRC